MNSKMLIGKFYLSDEDLIDERSHIIRMYRTTKPKNEVLFAMFDRIYKITKILIKRRVL